MDRITERHTRFRETYKPCSDHVLKGDFFGQFFTIQPMVFLLQDKTSLYTSLGTRCLIPPIPSEDILHYRNLRPNNLLSSTQSDYCECLDYSTILTYILNLNEINVLHSLLLVKYFLQFCISPCYGISMFYKEHHYHDMQATHLHLSILNQSIYDKIKNLNVLLISLKWELKNTSNRRQPQAKHAITDAIIDLALFLKKINIELLYSMLDFTKDNEMYARGTLNPMSSYPFVVALFDCHVFSKCRPSMLCIDPKYIPTYPYKTIYLANLTKDNSLGLQHMIIYFSSKLNFNHLINYDDTFVPDTMYEEMKRWLLRYTDTNRVLEYNINSSNSNISSGLNTILRERLHEKEILDAYTSLVFDRYWQTFAILYAKFKTHYTMDRDFLGGVLHNLEEHKKTDCSKDSWCFTFSTIPFWALVLRHNQVKDSGLPTFKIRVGEHFFESAFPHIVEP